jgi:hypothetical protein
MKTNGKPYRFTYHNENSLTMSTFLISETINEIRTYERCGFVKAYANLIKSPIYKEFFYDNCEYIDYGNAFHEYQYYNNGIM